MPQREAPCADAEGREALMATVCDRSIATAAGALPVAWTRWGGWRFQANGLTE